MDSLFMEFLNTRWPVGGEAHTDSLQDPEWVNDFLRRWHLPAQSALSDRQVRQLAELRTLLGQAVSAVASGDDIGREVIGQINDWLQSTALHYALEPGDHGVEAVLKPALTGWDGVLQGIVLSFAEFLSEHDPARLRECQNPDCRWVFYDETKNASRKWCGNTCASLVKVRRFRERRRSEDKR